MSGSSINICTEIIRFFSSAILAGLGIAIGFHLWKKQEISKSQKETGLKFLSFLERYSLSINTFRDGRFQLYDTEENIYQEKWNQLIKIWTDIQNEYTLVALLFPEQIKGITLNRLSELQNELKANLDTYLSRKYQKTWKGDTSDQEIEKILFKSKNIQDEFGDKIQNEINKLSNPIKTQLSKQFNTKL